MLHLRRISISFILTSISLAVIGYLDSTRSSLAILSIMLFHTLSSEATFQKKFLYIQILLFSIYLNTVGLELRFENKMNLDLFIDHFIYPDWLITKILFLVDYLFSFSFLHFSFMLSIHSSIEYPISSFLNAILPLPSQWISNYDIASFRYDGVRSYGGFIEMFKTFGELGFIILGVIFGSFAGRIDSRGKNFRLFMSFILLAAFFVILQYSLRMGVRVLTLILIILLMPKPKILISPHGFTRR